MCSDPKTHDGKTFACRVCNECIATRRHSWVARAMAEKALHPHALCLALTYSDRTEKGRDGARMFAYADVRDFLKRLRSAAHYAVEKENERRIEEAGHVFVETLPAPVVRFLCAGEQGSRNGRCHWHLILFSNLDLLTLGEITLRGRKLTDRADIMTVGKRKRRCHWSLWADDKTPLGFVTFQEPDQGGMSYVLSYCLKDQFTV